MKRNILTLVLAIVSSVWMMSEAQINSLCDTWNVVAYGNCFSAACPYITTIYTLTTDTNIGTIPYTKIETADQYPLCYGAMREGTNRDIYFIPSGGTHEYLLYAFNAQVGDLLSNLWISWDTNRNPNGPEGYTGTVQNITNGTPRIFTISITPREGDGVGTPSQVEWVEGVGFKRNPLNAKDYSYVDASIEEVLCAYKNGKQIYASALSEEIGCEYNGYGPEGNWRFFTLCDEWNVLEISNVTCGYCEEYRTYNFHLTTDTVIGGLLYSQLIKDGAYKGALREGNNRDIYCVPAGSTKEYLLYAFNALVGDTLRNIWVGGTSTMIPDIRSAVVSEIKKTTPRTIELEVHYYEAPDAYEESIRNLTWIEGIGMPFGPMGAECSVFNGCADSKAKLLLCAYKNGEQVYVSEMGEQYGCEYNYNPNTNHTDTIPLYAQDDSGSSTVDPVDPNQIYATLTGDVLTVHNRTGAQVTFTLNNTSVNNVAARARKNGQPTSFTESISVELTEDGLYEIWLTSEEWNYSIFGTINYVRSGTEITKEETSSTSKKVLRGTQILIEREGKTYTLTGQEVK